MRGDTSRKALERIYYDVLSKGVDITIIQFGLNRAVIIGKQIRVCQSTAKCFQENMVEIITRLINHNCSIISYESSN